MFRLPFGIHIDKYISKICIYLYQERESKHLFRLPLGGHCIAWKRLKIGPQEELIESSIAFLLFLTFAMVQNVYKGIIVTSNIAHLGNFISVQKYGMPKFILYVHTSSTITDPVPMADELMNGRINKYHTRPKEYKYSSDNWKLANSLYGYKNFRE